VLSEVLEARARCATAASVGVDAAAPVSPAQAPTKLCPGCREREWPMSRLVCRRDEGDCGSKMNADKMHRESIHSTAPQHVASEVGGSTYFANADAALREQKGVSKSFTAVTPGISSFSRGGDDAVDPAENDWSPNYRKEIILPLMNSPSTEEDILQIIKRYAYVFFVFVFPHMLTSRCTLL
jgi:hypothetical protein